MKNRYVIITLILIVFTCTSSYAKISKDSIFRAMTLFYQETESKSNYDAEECVDYIMEVESKNTLLEQDYGMFHFFTLSSSHPYSHFILIDEDSYTILNMRESLYTNLTKTLAFFEKNKDTYSKESILLNIKALTKVYSMNKFDDALKSAYWIKDKEGGDIDSLIQVEFEKLLNPVGRQSIVK